MPPRHCDHFCHDQAYAGIIFFFFNDTATTEIYTLSLHDALPISRRPAIGRLGVRVDGGSLRGRRALIGASNGLRSEEHTSELQSHSDLVCRLLLEKKKQPTKKAAYGLSTLQPFRCGSVSDHPLNT